MFVLVAMVTAGAAADAQMSIRVMTYNIHHGEGTDKKLDLERIAAIIAAEHPDVVCLQEIDRNLPRTGKQDFPAILSRQLGMQGVFEPNYRFDGGEYGNMTLTRLPILSHENIAMPNPKGAEPRGVLRTTIELNGQAVDVLNAHLGLDAEERKAQASEIVTRLRDMPTILAGDMNETNIQPAIQILLQRLTERPVDADNLIDHIFVNKFISVASSAIVLNDATSVASDHRPITADVELREALTPLEKRGISGTEDRRLEQGIEGIAPHSGATNLPQAR
jgi:endonuclease/exonuclease/phosphatase family metal-dependent hydrolase